jgi:hypothetical protein
LLEGVETGNRKPETGTGNRKPGPEIREAEVERADLRGGSWLPMKSTVFPRGGRGGRRWCRFGDVKPGAEGGECARRVVQ